MNTSITYVSVSSKLLSRIEQSPAVKATNTLLDRVIFQKELKNDAALCRAMGVAPPLVSKLRHGVTPLGAAMIIKIHELTEWPIKEIKAAIAGDNQSAQAA